MQNKQGILGAGSIHDTLWQTDAHTQAHSHTCQKTHDQTATDMADIGGMETIKLSPNSK